MSKINQIENALKSISGGEFQKLADSYIHKKSYQNINPIGSVIGADKVRKGTPDSYVRQDNGKLVFAEFTTEQNNLSSKLKRDLSKCLDESKTGIPLTEIEEIVFCHTSLISPEEEQELYAEGQKHGIKIQVFGIGRISFDLYQKYPGLAQDFLGVSIDTGQILEPGDFVENVGRNQLATPLDTAFHFREQEIQQILEGLESYNLVIVSGQGGVGKSRLALQALQNFKDSHPDFETRCIYNRGPDLFEDIRTHFSQSGQFLILVDDANRITQFDYIVDLVQNQRQDQQIKVIATVRDYARDKINQAARALGETPEIELEPMQAQEIKSLVNEQYNITNPLFLDRIADIAGGNSRLAIMAARIAVKQNNLGSISDVTNLYDEYFASISNDLRDLHDENVLKVAGIISFFRTIDCSNEEIMQLIQNVFGISPEDFWKAVQHLHDCEVADIYEREVVKISDQVFATYLFYLCFFKEEILSFSTLIDNFFPGQNNRLRDAIYPCLNAFNFERLTMQIRPHIQMKWHDLTDTGDTDNQYALIQLFWFFLQSDTLVYISDRIATLNTGPVELSSINWTEEDPDTDLHPLLNLLGLFRQADEEGAVRSALELACKYVEKIPQSAPQFIALMTKRFGFTHQSHLRGYLIQKIVIKILWKKADRGQDELFSRLFLAVAKKYTPTRFNSHEASSKNSIVVHQFNLLEIESIFELRRTMWDGVLYLYENTCLQEEVIDVLKTYSCSGYLLSQNKIISKDAELIVLFITDSLSPDNFAHCLIVQNYAAMLNRRNIPGADALSQNFRNGIYEIYELLSFDYSAAADMNFREFEKLKKQKIRDHTREFGLDDYSKLIQQCIEILSCISGDHQTHNIKAGILEVLVALAERDGPLGAQVIQEYLKSGDPLAIRPPALIIGKLLKSCGNGQTLRIIEEPEYPTKRPWLFGYYLCLSPEDIGPETIDNLYKLYREAELTELPYDYDYLLNYKAQDAHIVVNVTNIIVEKAETDEIFCRGLASLFNPNSEVNQQIFDLFEGHQDSLEKAYMLHSKVDKDADYNGETLARILSVNPDFILEYVDRVYDADGTTHSYIDTRDYAFLWHHEGCDFIMSRAIDRTLQHEKKRGYILGSYLEHLFCVHNGRECPPEIVAKQDEFLTAIIQEQAQNNDLMDLIFRPISHFSPERRKRFIELFLENNKSYEDFEKLALEPSTWSLRGSAVPMYQARVEYWESLLPLCNTVDLLQHRLYIERHVEANRKAMEAEKKSDFMDNTFAKTGDEGERLNPV